MGLRRTPTRSAVDGALALAAAMGIGRFAYTALLPATQRALGAGDDVAGAIAPVNLAGYRPGGRAAGGPCGDGARDAPRRRHRGPARLARAPRRGGRGERARVRARLRR